MQTLRTIETTPTTDPSRSPSEIAALVERAAHSVRRRLAEHLAPIAHEQAMEYELARAGLAVGRGVPLSVVYRDTVLDVTLEPDRLVDGAVVLHLDFAPFIDPDCALHVREVLKSSGYRVGVCANLYPGLDGPVVQRIVESSVQ